MASTAGGTAVQRTEGARSILSSAEGYSLFQELAGATRLRRWLAEHFWKIAPGSKVVDIGCGPGVVLPFLPPEIEFVGFDPSARYIELANRRFASRPRTTFLCGVAADFLEDARFQEADVVLCNGVLHHLDDREASEVLRFARRVLKVGGAFRCLEACYLVHQGRISRWITGLDRGANIRYEQEWKTLMGGVFDPYITRITTNLIRLPYIHILLEGFKPK
jgi:SAM-dependent methyltransferase